MRAPAALVAAIDDVHHRAAHLTVRLRARVDIIIHAASVRDSG